jgi:hypothetical protein
LAFKSSKELNNNLFSLIKCLQAIFNLWIDITINLWIHK